MWLDLGPIPCDAAALGSPPPGPAALSVKAKSAPIQAPSSDPLSKVKQQTSPRQQSTSQAMQNCSLFSTSKGIFHSSARAVVEFWSQPRLPMFSLRSGGKSHFGSRPQLSKSKPAVGPGDPNVQPSPEKFQSCILHNIFQQNLQNGVGVGENWTWGARKVRWGG